MIKLKDSSVKLKDLSPQIVLALIVAESIFRRNGYEDCIITSLNDGKHSVNSKHYIGYAVDIRSKHIATTLVKQKILKELQEALTNGKNYDILLESLGGDNEHYHIEYDPK